MRISDITVLAGLAAAALGATAAEAQPVSGQYGPLLLVVQGDRIAGVVADEVGGVGTQEAPQFTCRALLDGRLAGDVAQVEAWLPDDPERIAGTLAADGDGVRVTLDENPPGCAMALNMRGEGQRWFGDEGREDWIGVGLVAPGRLVLQKEPRDDPAKTRPYLVEWDPVAVLEFRDGWARVEYVADGPPTIGWVRASELALGWPSAR